jgi:hypothetical protein
VPRTCSGGVRPVQPVVRQDPRRSSLRAVDVIADGQCRPRSTFSRVALKAVDHAFRHQNPKLHWPAQTAAPSPASHFTDAQQHEIGVAVTVDIQR